MLPRTSQCSMAAELELLQCHWIWQFTCNAVPHVQTKHSCNWFHGVSSGVNHGKHCSQHSSKKCHCQEQHTADPEPCIDELPVWEVCNTFTWTVRCYQSQMKYTDRNNTVLSLTCVVGGPLDIWARKVPRPMQQVVQLLLACLILRLAGHEAHIFRKEAGHCNREHPTAKQRWAG